MRLTPHCLRRSSMKAATVCDMRVSSFPVGTRVGGGRVSWLSRYPVARREHFRALPGWAANKGRLQPGEHLVTVCGEERVLIGADLVHVELVEAGVRVCGDRG